MAKRRCARKTNEEREAELVRELRALRANIEKAELQLMLRLHKAETVDWPAWLHTMGHATFLDWIGPHGLKLCEPNRYARFRDGLVNKLGGETKRAVAIGAGGVMALSIARDDATTPRFERAVVDWSTTRGGTHPHEFRAKQIVLAIEGRTQETRTEPGELSRLRAENRRLRAKVERLEAEVARLKGAAA